MQVFVRISTLKWGRVACKHIVTHFQTLKKHVFALMSSQLDIKILISMHFCRTAIDLVFLYILFKTNAFLWRMHIFTHFCEQLAWNCKTFNISWMGIFVCRDIWLFLKKKCKCVHPCMHLTYPQTHAHATPQPHLISNHSCNHTHTRACTLMWILSAVLSWGSRPVRFPWRSSDQGRKSLSLPQAPPSAPRLGSGSWEADAMQDPSVARFCGQSI